MSIFQTILADLTVTEILSVTQSIIITIQYDFYVQYYDSKH